MSARQVPVQAEQNRIEAAVTDLESTPDEWGAFCRLLEQISNVTAGALPLALTTPPRDAALIGQTSPVAIEHANLLLTGSELTIPQWRATVADASATIALLRKILSLGVRASRYQAALAALATPSPDAERALASANSKLWRVDSDRALEGRAPEGDLDAIAEALSLLGLPPPPAGLVAGAGPAGVPLIFVEEPPAGIAERLRKRIARVNGAIVLLAIVLAVLLALRDYYFDKAFGTPKDYIAVILYGTGSKLGLDLVNISLQGLLSRSSK